MVMVTTIVTIDVGCWGALWDALGPCILPQARVRVPL